MTEKLVRDRIPEVIGPTARVRYAGPGEILPLLLAKVVEEAAEVARSGGDAEEIGDLIEVLAALAAHRGHTQAEIAALRARKRQERGGFERGAILLAE